MKKLIVILLSVLFLLPAFVLPCLAEPEVGDEADAVEESAVMDYGAEDIDELPQMLADSGVDVAEPPVLSADGAEEGAGFDGVVTYGAAAVSLPRVVDEADLFTPEEELALNERIAAIGAEFSFDVVLVTTNYLGGKSDMAYADDFYDYGGYGYGENHDGCLLLIHMDEDRGYWISTTGLGINALSDADIDSIGEDIVPKLSAGNYAGACEIFLDDVREQVNIQINGRGFQLKLLVIGAVIGLVVALIVVGVLKGQLKSVHFKSSASDYFVDGSLALTGAYDVLVGHHVTRTKRQSESSSGSSTHTGSSGTSHGGGGGRF